MNLVGNRGLDIDERKRCRSCGSIEGAIRRIASARTERRRQTEPQRDGRDRRATKGAKIGAQIKIAWWWSGDTAAVIPSGIKTGRALYLIEPPIKLDPTMLWTPSTCVSPAGLK